MDYAAVLYFDQVTQAKIIKIMNQLGQLGADQSLLEAGIKPHLTLASWTGNEENYEVQLRKFIKESCSLPITFSSIGIFPDPQKVIYLAPVKDQLLINLHQSFYKCFAGAINDYNNFYLPEHWVPHCTLAGKLTDYQLLQALDLLLKLSLPLKAVVTEFALIKCESVNQATSCEALRVALRSY